jgi:glycosyltransferase involved in cell wall biosynthesis
MKVSVVIPVHNGEKYLAQAIESVLAQTFRDFELLIVDDGSTDGSAEIARTFVVKDRRVRLISQPNGGVVSAGNRGLKEARYEWIARLDADDVFLPEKIERQVSFIRRNPDVKIVGTLAWFISAEGFRLGLVGTEGPFCREDFQRLTRDDDPVFFVHSSTLMHRETVLAVGGYRKQFIQAEDVDLWIRMAEARHLMLKVDEPLLLYRLHGASLTMTRNAEQRRHQRWAIACGKARKRGEEEPALNEFILWEKKRPWPERLRAYRSESGERLYQKAALYYACGKYPALASCLCLAVCLNPGHVIPRLYDRKIAPALEKGILGKRPVPIPIPGEKEACRHAPGT